MPITEKSYDVMYPGRFLKSADLDGKIVTVTIADINAEELEGDKNKKKREYILTFVGKKKAFVLNKTNACLIVQMFGKNPNTWRGKRVTIYPTQCRFGPKMVDCIRVFGSPDVTEDVTVAEKIGRSMLKTTLRAVKGSKPEAAPPPPQDEPPEQEEPDSSVLEAWSVLGWSREQGQADFDQQMAVDGSVSGYLAHLNALIDQDNSKEEVTF
jgi:hypothetical protein